MSTTTNNTHREVTKVVVVKKCLVHALNPNLLDHQKTYFTNYVADATEFASRMVRRASLAFLYFVTRMLEDGRSLADIENKKDGYWKSWLRIGLDEYGNPMPEGVDPKYFDEIKNELGTRILPNDKEIPYQFDRILGHAAIAFKTSVMNCQEVPMIDRLSRLCRIVAKPIGNVSGYDVLKAVRNGDVPCDWPISLHDFVAEVRVRLKIKDGDILYDDTDIALGVRYDFHWWMQGELERMDKRKIAMSPVNTVSRMHVRLDATMLFVIARKCFEPDAPSPCAPVQPNPSTNDVDWHEKSEMRKASMRERQAYKKSMQEYRNLYKEFEKEFPSYSKLAEQNPSDPDTELNKQHPFPKPLGKQHEDIDDVAWKQVKTERAALVKAIAAIRQGIKSTPEFAERSRLYAIHVETVHSFGRRLFRPFTDKNAKNGWSASNSVVTDGVSISITYEKTIMVPIIDKDEKKKKKKPVDERIPHDDYDPLEPTIARDALVIGVDPGRITICTAVCIDAKGRKHTWKLSRSQYYTEGGIFRESRRQSKRLASLETSFATLASNGGSLKASNSAQIRAYLAAYVVFRDQWYDKILMRCESRAKMTRYIGKRRVMATFFSNMRKDANKLLTEPGQRIEVAYGAAKFASTSRGEIAVPTSGAFHACRSEFSTTLVPEYNTSKVSWDTKQRFEAAYKRYKNTRGAVVEILDHTSQKYMPFVRDQEIATIIDVRAQLREKNARRRGKHKITEEDVATKIAEDTENNKLRYTECRGLRFCTERRMYYDRDVASARAIAGLRCLEMRGLRRPSIFTPATRA
jgi:hypothetical protein